MGKEQIHARPIGKTLGLLALADWTEWPSRSSFGMKVIVNHVGVLPELNLEPGVESVDLMEL